MNSSRPYLLRGIYEWLLDNKLTPHVMVDALFPGVEVPERFVEDGKIVLNIETHAVGNLCLGNEAVEFDARFSGIPYHVYVPVKAIKAIYAFENGRGMVFNEDDEDGSNGSGPSSAKDNKSPTQKKGRPNLKVVK